MEIWNKLSPAGDDAELLHVATYLPLKGWRHVIPFLAMSMRIEKQLKHSSGVVSYGLRAKVANRHFWTLSIWTDRKRMNEFINSEPHRTAVKRFAQWAGRGAAFAEWAAVDDQDAIWTTALEKLKNPTFYYQG